MKLHIFILSIVMIIISSCDGGLAPKPVAEKTFLKGTVHFVKGVSNWPPTDSVLGIRVAAFKSMPDSNIILSILSGQAYFTGESLGSYKDSLNFNIEIPDAPVDIVYIVAVQQYTTEITNQKVIGVYTLTGDKTKHSNILIEKGRTYDIDIDVDFDDLPPMPF
jgi:hypothetical protein